MNVIPNKIITMTPYSRRPAAAEYVPFVPALVVVAAFIPEALGFFIAGLRLTWARAVLLILAPFVFFRFWKLVTSGRYRFVFSDLLIPFASVWTVVALANVDGSDIALKSGGVDGLEFVVGYAVTRCLPQNKGEAHAIIRLFCIAAAIAGLLGLLDTFSGYWVLRTGLARLTGYTFYQAMNTDVSDYYRLGFFRAEGPLEHPILLGVAMCYGLMLSNDVEGRARVFCRLGCGVGLLIALESAPWQATILGLGLLLYGRVAHFPHRWLFLVAIGMSAFAIFYMMMANPFGWLFNHITLDASTGYFRLMIWTAAGDDVMQSPIFGIGTTADWTRPDWMPNSVDSLWLRTAMISGIPGALLMAFALMGASSRVVRRTTATVEAIGEREVKLAETLGVVTFLTLFLGFTVDYFGSSTIIVTLLTGMRAFLGQLAHERKG